MDLRDVHYDYVVNVMEQDPEVIKELIYLIDEIEMITFICEVDIVVCESLCLSDVQMGETLRGI